MDADLDLSDLREFSAILHAVGTLDGARVKHWSELLSHLDSRLVTVLDDDYPANLRMIHDHPPFLFVRGSLAGGDDRAVVVVGTRRPSAAGVGAASEIAIALARRGITVVSGMAVGIDTAAHMGALDAGGRSLAVFGAGIDHV